MYMSESEHRQHTRHLSHFEIQVIPADESSNKFHETPLLRDISNSGMSFVTKHPEWFRIGQRLSLTMNRRHYQVTCHLEGTATIIWLMHCDHAINQAFVVVPLDDLIAASQYLSS